MTEPEPYKIDVDDDRWEVHVGVAGTTYTVDPVCGFSGMENWEFYTGKNGRYQFWRVFTGYRLCYPKTERQLKKAIAACQRFCDSENRRLDTSRELQRRLDDGDPAFPRPPHPMAPQQVGDGPGVTQPW